MIMVVRYGSEKCASYNRLVHLVIIQTLNDTVTIQSVQLILGEYNNMYIYNIFLLYIPIPIYIYYYILSSQMISTYGGCSKPK